MYSSLHVKGERCSKFDLLQFHRNFFLLLTQANLLFSDYLIRRTVTYLCPNLVNFDEGDFSECRSIFFFFFLFQIFIQGRDWSSTGNCAIKYNVESNKLHT